MTTLIEIETAVLRLTSGDFSLFCEWLEEIQAKRFDDRIAQDARAGRLDRLAAEAIADVERGDVRDL